MKANKVATGSELMRVASGLDLAEMIDSNTALAVAETTKDLEECFTDHNRVINHLTNELELCKSHNLMLSGYLHQLKAIIPDEFVVAQNTIAEALSATKETIEAYRNEIVQKAKSEQLAEDIAAVDHAGGDNECYHIEAMQRRYKGD